MWVFPKVEIYKNYKYTLGQINSAEGLSIIWENNFRALLSQQKIIFEYSKTTNLSIFLNFLKGWE